MSANKIARRGLLSGLAAGLAGWFTGTSTEAKTEQPAGLKLVRLPDAPRKGSVFIGTNTWRWSCPVHGEIKDTLTITLNQPGMSRTFCPACLMDAMSRFAASCD